MHGFDQEFILILYVLVNLLVYVCMYVRVLVECFDVGVCGWGSFQVMEISERVKFLLSNIFLSFSSYFLFFPR